jgi:putative two-component system response regulator
LSGEDIPESARIVALADVFDALCMKRPYKEAWSIERIVEQIQGGAGKHFDPRLVGVFSESLPQILDIRKKWSGAE